MRHRPRRLALAPRHAGALAFAAALVACATPAPPVQQRPAEELLSECRSGRVRLECSSCRYEHRSGDTLLRDGHVDALVVGILRSGDASGRSWYLLGRAAEEEGLPEVALLYYREALATSRNPVLAMWPLYDDLHYRIRRLEAPAQSPVAAEHPAPEAPREREVEFVDVRALSVRDAPNDHGRVVASLRRGQRVEVAERSGDWERVVVDGIDAGWVSGRFTLTKVAATPVADAKSAEAAKAAEGAKPAPVATAPAAAKRTAPAAEPAVAAKRPAATPSPAAPKAAPGAGPALAAAAATGMLGCPLPSGASLAGSSHGVGGSDDHATQTYKVRAAARAIVGFYEREMQRAGWQKSELSTEYLLYFEKGERTLGVLVDRNGNAFTLMGS